ncbi:MAG: sugar phosphate isomerase/epimerase family protein [Planctomycetota bacterium]
MNDDAGSASGSGPGLAAGRGLAVCSWSLQPSSLSDLVSKLGQTGLQRVQLALGPMLTGDWDEAETVAALRDAGIEIVSGMLEMAGEDYSTLETIAATGGVRPDATWNENVRLATEASDMAARLGMQLVTFHAGFIPHDASDPERAKVIERVRTVADVFAANGVRVGLETGQESASTLLAALDALDHESIGVNFDPANMILYGMGDPVEAVRTLAGRVVQVHAKDAIASERPGEWGTEVPIGAGDVRWAELFGVLREIGFEGDVVIEREAGEDRIGDVVRGVAKLLAE